MNIENKTNIFFVVGSSGSGKDTLVKELVKNVSNNTKLVSHTSRKIRKNLNGDLIEQNGYDYYFEEPNIFLEGIKNDFQKILEKKDDIIKFYKDNNKKTGTDIGYILETMEKHLNENNIESFFSLKSILEKHHDIYFFNFVDNLNFPQLIIKNSNDENNFKGFTFYGYSGKEIDNKSRESKNLFIIIQPNGIEQLEKIFTNKGYKPNIIFLDINENVKLKRLINREGEEVGKKLFKIRKSEDKMFKEFRDNINYKKIIIDTSNKNGVEEVIQEFQEKINIKGLDETFIDKKLNKNKNINFKRMKI